MERRGFYMSATSLYDKCRSIFTQLTQLDLSDEAHTAESYKQKKEACLAKIFKER